MEPEGSSPTPEAEPGQPRVKGSRTERLWIYVIAAAVFGGLIVWGIIAFSQKRETNEAKAKADELIQLFKDEDLTAPDKDIVVRLLGTDGGRVCEFAGDRLNEASLKLNLYTNGAAGPGMRPGPVDERLLQGAILVAEVYCPDKLEKFRELADDFEFHDVIRE